MKRIILLGIIILLTGCAYQTKPNISYLYSIPSLKQELPLDEKKTIKERKESFSSTEIRANDLFEKLYSKNSEIAIELGKLPEFQDGIDEKEVLALERVVNLYLNSSKEEKNIFDEMLKTGKPEFRKYCSPLQALFWLAERQDFSEANNPLKNYSLIRLLDEAWIFGYEFSKEDAISILRAMKDKQYAERLIEINKENLNNLNYLVSSFLKDSKEAWDIYEYKNIVKGKGINRWSEYDVVSDRLNSPELISFYSKRNFSYVLQGQRQITARYIFFSKKGCCQDYTAFAEDCLHNAGYDVKAIIVKSPTGHPKGHSVCEFKGKDGKEYILDDSCGSCTGGKGIEEKESYVKRLPQIGTGYDLVK